MFVYARTEGFLPGRIITRIISAPLGISLRESYKIREDHIKAFPTGGHAIFERI